MVPWAPTMGGAIWNFISYPASKGNFVATTQGVNSWWSRYGETAMGNHNAGNLHRHHRRLRRVRSMKRIVALCPRSGLA